MHLAERLPIARKIKGTNAPHISTRQNLAGSLIGQYAIERMASSAKIALFI